MSLVTRLSALATAIGVDIKALRASSAKQGAYRGTWGVFSKKIVLNFEAGVPVEFNDAIARGWTVVSRPDGVGGLTKSLKSPVTLSNARSIFNMSFNLAGSPPQVVVRFQTSTEASYDIFTLYQGDSAVGSASGIDTAWKTMTATGTGGDTLYEFRYLKDASNDLGEDAVFINQVTADVLDPGALYQYGDFVDYQGDRYICLVPGTSANPSDTTKWMKVPIAPTKVVTKTASAVLALTDANKYIAASSATALSYTVPPQADVPWGADVEITFEQTGTGVLTFNPGAGVTLNKMSTNTLTTAGQFGVVTLKRTGPDTWTLLGALGVV